MPVTPRFEQEALICYDKELDQWHLYSDVPTLNRKWQDKVTPESTIAVEENGTVSLIDGYLLEGCSVSIRSPRKLTEEQKAELSARAKENFGL